MMTGRNVDATEALAIGLVNRIVEGKSMEEAVAFARAFTTHSLLALRLVRDSAQRAMTTTLAEGLRIEADLSTLSMRSEDGREGLAAFIAKRPPKFIDR
jgi:enoyl-CoA hydratase